MTSTQHFPQQSPIICDSGNPWNKNFFFLFISYQCISYPSAFPASHMNVWHPQPPVARSPTAPFISLCLASFWLYLVLPAAHLKGEWPVNPCSSSSPISGLHIWPCPWLKCSNLPVIHKEAIPTFEHPHCFLWTFIHLYFFWLEGRNCTVLKIWYTIACASRIFSTYSLLKFRLLFWPLVSTADHGTRPLKSQFAWIMIRSVVFI